MISVRVNSFSWAVPPRQDCLLVYPRYVFIIIPWKSIIRLTELSSVRAINNSKLKKKKKKKKKSNEQWKQYLYLKISMQSNWAEKYLTYVVRFSHVNVGWKVCHSGEAAHLEKMSHLVNSP